MAEEGGNPERSTEDETPDGQEDDYAPSSFFDDAMYGQEIEELLSTVPDSVFHGSNDNPDLSQSLQHAQSAKSNQATQDEEKAMMKRQNQRMDAHQYRTYIKNAYLAEKPEKPEKPELVVDDNGVATVQMVNIPHSLQLHRIKLIHVQNANRAREAQPEQQQEPQPVEKQNAPALSPLPQGPLVARGPKKRDSARKAQQGQQEEPQPTLTWKTPLAPGSRGPKKAKMD